MGGVDVAVNECSECIYEIKLFDKDQYHLITLCWRTVLHGKCIPVKEERKNKYLSNSCGEKGKFFRERNYTTVHNKEICADPTIMENWGYKGLELK
jgi:hypothetical protein